MEEAALAGLRELAEDFSCSLVVVDLGACFQKAWDCVSPFHVLPPCALLVEVEVGGSRALAFQHLA